MLKEKWNKVRDFIVKNSKIVFPVVLVLVVALTVLIALKAIRSRNNTEELPESGSVVESSEETRPEADKVPMVENDNEKVKALIDAYYLARGNGDMEGMLAVSDYVSETDLLYYAELSKYIDQYSGFEIFTKEGPLEGSYVAYVYLKMCITNYGEVPGYETHYVCTNDEGKLYIKNQNNCNDEERAYIKTLCEQLDVVEFNNRVNVEYNELMASNPELLEYLGALGEQVQIAVGEKLGEQNASEEVVENTDENGETNTEDGGEETAEENGPQYAKASTTVNVRSSDSENADKLGKLSSGTKVQVQEVRVNGWTKIVYEGKDGYVKSEFLVMEESAGNFETIGTVTANTNINVRSAASETADRLGVLTGGESAELIAMEGDWCKIKYNGQVGYVKAEYVSR